MCKSAHLSLHVVIASEFNNCSESCCEVQAKCVAISGYLIWCIKGTWLQFVLMGLVHNVLLVFMMKRRGIHNVESKNEDWILSYAQAQKTDGRESTPSKHVAIIYHVVVQFSVSPHKQTCCLLVIHEMFYQTGGKISRWGQSPPSSTLRSCVLLKQPKKLFGCGYVNTSPWFRGPYNDPFGHDLKYVSLGDSIRDWQNQDLWCHISHHNLSMPSRWRLCVANPPTTIASAIFKQEVLIQARSTGFGSELRSLQLHQLPSSKYGISVSVGAQVYSTLWVQTLQILTPGSCNRMHRVKFGGGVSLLPLPQLQTLFLLDTIRGVFVPPAWRTTATIQTRTVKQRIVDV